MSFFGETLTELREERNLTQRQLAEALSISNSSISAYETGSRMPPADMLIKMSQYFDVTTDYLLGLTKNRFPPSLINREIYDGMTVSELIRIASGLLPDEKRALIVVLRSMGFYSDVAGRHDGIWPKSK